MKRSFFKSFGALALLSVLFIGLSSCGGGSKADMIAKTWKIEDIQMPDTEIPEGMEEMFDSMMEEMKKSSSFTFNGDGTYSATMATPMGEQTSTGKWELSEDGNSITMTDDEDGEAESAQVKELSSSKFVMQMDADGETMVLTLAPK